MIANGLHRTLYPSTSTTSSSSSSTSSSTSTSSAPPTTIIINATSAVSSSIAATSSPAAMTAGGRHGSGTGAFVGIGVGSSVLLIAMIWFLYYAYKRFQSKQSPSPYDADEQERREKHRRSVLRRQEALRQHLAADTKTERFKSMIYGQGREISHPTITGVGTQSLAPGTQWPPPQSRPQPPQRPVRPSGEVDTIIAAAQHGRMSQVYDEENGIEMDETNHRESDFTIPDPLFPTPQPPRRPASSIYSQQTSQPFLAQRGTVNTTTMNNAINNTLQEYASGSTPSPPPHYSVMDESVYDQAASQFGNGAGNTYSQYGDDTANYRNIEENEDDVEKRDRERDRAMRLLMGEKVEPSNRDTGLSGLFGMRKTNR